MFRKKYNIDKLFVFVVYGTFMLMSLLLVLLGTHIYKNLVEKAEANSSARVSVYYAANRIRSGAADGVRHEIIDGTGALIFSDGAVQTLVYYHEGFLWELLKFEHEPFIPEYGEKIAAVSGFSVSEENGVFTITSVASDGSVSTMYVSSRS